MDRVEFDELRIGQTVIKDQTPIGLGVVYRLPETRTEPAADHVGDTVQQGDHAEQLPDRLKR